MVRWWPSDALLLLALTAAYVCTGKLGLAMDAVSGFATLVWAPTGIALATIALIGYRTWPVVWLSAFLVNRWTGAPLLVACAIGIGNTLEAVAGSWLLRRIPGFRPQLDRVEDVIGLVVLAAFLSTTISASMGTVALLLGGQLTAPFGTTWRTWWLGDMIGDLIVAPVLLTMPPTSRVREYLRAGHARLAEALALTVVLGASSAYLFFGGAIEVRYEVHRRPFMVLPALIWAALRFGVRGLARALLIVTVIAIWGTAAAHKPFYPGALRGYLVDLQIYLAAMAGIFLILSAVAEERERALAQAVESERKLSILADASAILASTLEFKTAATELAKIVAGRLGRACGCTIDLFAPSGELQRYATAAADVEKQHLLEEEGRFLTKAPSKSPILRACQAGRTLLVPDVDRTVLDELSQNAEHRALLERLELHSLMIVPMAAREHVLGVITVPSMRPERHYSDVELAFLEELARRAAVHIDNARLFEAATDAVRARDDTLAVVAHDLRSPLGAIKLSAQVLKQGADPKRIAVTARTISSASDRMNHLVDELLESAFVQSGAFALDRRAFAAEEVVDECVLLHSPAAAAQSVAIRKKTDPEARVVADRERLLQVLGNLVANAIRFTPPGGSVEVRVERGEGSVVFSVTDSGPGIPAELIPHVFERYWTGTSREGVHGLGLFIAHAIVEAHGGRFEVSSQLGVGSTFRFSIPTPATPDERPPG